ncbi:hypothetical protein CEUSTIGMA_g5248.t1 [Chlamydomonas eustigma]|uniref:JmjC domain-containing protein n=1 Tax=Chlamydomonas eustigma TaxID=1157962 RepID=A0A250X406_9CHLO|nr:hypothetical protein CEUSTIGMA_g5248.t1 [Chlamydomonas eustigma]|eukprot:GAX77805.1 hypothetical protein CEUSTIGMA_g5248.t1 [Chlamydomonas eustigma]
MRPTTNESGDMQSGTLEAWLMDQDPSIMTSIDCIDEANMEDDTAGGPLTKPQKSAGKNGRDKSCGVFKGYSQQQEILLPMAPPPPRPPSHLHHPLGCSMHRNQSHHHDAEFSNPYQSKPHQFESTQNADRGGPLFKRPLSALRFRALDAGPVECLMGSRSLEAGPVQHYVDWDHSDRYYLKSGYYEEVGPSHGLHKDPGYLNIWPSQTNVTYLSSDDLSAHFVSYPAAAHGSEWGGHGQQYPHTAPHAFTSAADGSVLYPLESSQSFLRHDQGVVGQGKMYWQVGSTELGNQHRRASFAAVGRGPGTQQGRSSGADAATWHGGSWDKMMELVVGAGSEITFGEVESDEESEGQATEVRRLQRQQKYNHGRRGAGGEDRVTGKANDDCQDLSQAKGGRHGKKDAVLLPRGRVDRCTETILDPGKDRDLWNPSRANPAVQNKASVPFLDYSPIAPTGVIQGVTSRLTMGETVAACPDVNESVMFSIAANQVSFQALGPAALSGLEVGPQAQLEQRDAISGLPASQFTNRGGEVQGADMIEGDGDVMAQDDPRVLLRAVPLPELRPKQESELEPLRVQQSQHDKEQHHPAAGATPHFAVSVRTQTGLGMDMEGPEGGVERSGVKRKRIASVKDFIKAFKLVKEICGDEQVKALRPRYESVMSDRDAYGAAASHSLPQASDAFRVVSEAPFPSRYVEGVERLGRGFLHDAPHNSYPLGYGQDYRQYNQQPIFDPIPRVQRVQQYLLHPQVQPWYILRPRDMAYPEEQRIFRPRGGGARYWKKYSDVVHERRAVPRGDRGDMLRRDPRNVVRMHCQLQHPPLPGRTLSASTWSNIRIPHRPMRRAASPLESLHFGYDTSQRQDSQRYVGPYRVMPRSGLWSAQDQEEVEDIAEEEGEEEEEEEEEEEFGEGLRDNYVVSNVQGLVQPTRTGTTNVDGLRGGLPLSGDEGPDLQVSERGRREFTLHDHTFLRAPPPPKMKHPENNFFRPQVVGKASNLSPGNSLYSLGQNTVLLNSSQNKQTSCAKWHVSEQVTPGPINVHADTGPPPLPAQLHNRKEMNPRDEQHTGKEVHRLAGVRNMDVGLPSTSPVSSRPTRLLTWKGPVLKGKDAGAVTPVLVHAASPSQEEKQLSLAHGRVPPIAAAAEAAAAAVSPPLAAEASAPLASIAAKQKVNNAGHDAPSADTFALEDEGAGVASLKWQEDLVVSLPEVIEQGQLVSGRGRGRGRGKGRGWGRGLLAGRVATGLESTNLRAAALTGSGMSTELDNGRHAVEKRSQAARRAEGIRTMGLRGRGRGRGGRSPSSFPSKRRIRPPISSPSRSRQEQTPPPASSPSRRREERLTFGTCLDRQEPAPTSDPVKRRGRPPKSSYAVIQPDVMLSTGDTTNVGDSVLPATGKNALVSPKRELEAQLKEKQSSSPLSARRWPLERTSVVYEGLESVTYCAQHDRARSGGLRRKMKDSSFIITDGSGVPGASSSSSPAVTASAASAAAAARSGTATAHNATAATSSASASAGAASPPVAVPAAAATVLHLLGREDGPATHTDMINDASSPMETAQGEIRVADQVVAEDCGSIAEDRFCVLEADEQAGAQEGLSVNKEGCYVWKELFEKSGGVWQGSLAIGTQTGKVKLYSDRQATCQVTKSCHFCQCQHIFTTCCSGGSTPVPAQAAAVGTGGSRRNCSKSYCRKCLLRHFPGLSYWEASRPCPSCRGICCCKPCLREESGPPSTLTYNSSTLRALASYTISHLSKHVEKIISLEEAQAIRLGFAGLEAVPCFRIQKERLVCDCCTSAMPNLHVSCGACGWDMCAKCLSEQEDVVFTLREAASEGMSQEDAPMDVPQPPQPLIRCLNPACRHSRLGYLASNPKMLKDTICGWPVTARQCFEVPRLKLVKKMLMYSSSMAAAPGLSLDAITADWAGNLRRDYKAHAEKAGLVEYVECGDTGSGLPHITGFGEDQLPPQPQVCDISAAQLGVVEQNGRLWVWGRWMRREDIRLATWRDRLQAEGDVSPVVPAGMKVEELFLFCPHARCLKPSHPDFHEYLSIFMDRWQKRCPVIVRGCKGRMRWDPEVMMRACRELGCKRAGVEETDTQLEVIECAGWQSKHMTQHAFFSGYIGRQGQSPGGGADYDLKTGRESGVSERMLKVKDWPPEESFSKRLVRMNQDFLEMLPLPFYTHPKGGPLNLAWMLPPWSNPTDLGPKTYIAYGRVEEHEGEEGDSVTKLHLDMSDAVNIMCHLQKPQAAHHASAAAAFLSKHQGITSIADDFLPDKSLVTSSAAAPAAMEVQCLDAISPAQQQDVKTLAVAAAALGRGQDTEAASLSPMANHHVACSASVAAAIPEASVSVRCGLEAAVRGSWYGGAGAVWDIWQASHVPHLRKYLKHHLSEFRHAGRVLSEDMVHDVIFDQCCMVTSMHLDRMATGNWSNSAEVLTQDEPPTALITDLAAVPPFVPWHFEQHLHEAVFIPAGCPHQVRNLHSCLKVAVDFVPPESLESVSVLRDSMRECALKKRGNPLKPPVSSSLSDALGSPKAHAPISSLECEYQDKLQSSLIMMSAAAELLMQIKPLARTELKKALGGLQQQVKAGGAAGMFVRGDKVEISSKLLRSPSSPRVEGVHAGSVIRGVDSACHDGLNVGSQRDVHGRLGSTEALALEAAAGYEQATSKGWNSEGVGELKATTGQRGKRRKRLGEVQGVVTGGRSPLKDGIEVGAVRDWAQSRLKGLHYEKKENVVEEGGEEEDGVDDDPNDKDFDEGWGSRKRQLLVERIWKDQLKVLEKQQRKGQQEQQGKPKKRGRPPRKLLLEKKGEEVVGDGLGGEMMHIIHQFVQPDAVIKRKRGRPPNREKLLMLALQGQQVPGAIVPDDRRTGMKRISRKEEAAGAESSPRKAQEKKARAGPCNPPVQLLDDMVTHSSTPVSLSDGMRVERSPLQVALSPPAPLTVSSSPVMRGALHTCTQSSLVGPASKMPTVPSPGPSQASPVGDPVKKHRLIRQAVQAPVGVGSHAETSLNIVGGSTKSAGVAAGVAPLQVRESAEGVPGELWKQHLRSQQLLHDHCPSKQAQSSQ